MPINEGLETPLEGQLQALLASAQGEDGNLGHRSNKLQRPRRTTFKLWLEGGFGHNYPHPTPA